MKKKYIDLLKEMVAAGNLSGYTEEAESIFLREASSLGLLCGRDVLGNVSAKIPASEDRLTHYKPKNIMICSHHDTHGHLVYRVNDDGTFDLGTASLEHAEGKEGIIRTLYGIVPILFFDVDEDAGTAKASPADDSIDYSVVSEGDVVTLKPWVEERPRGKFSGTFLDNKVGCLATIMLMEKLVKAKYREHNIFIVHTSYEETSGYGIKAAVEKINPLFVINVDMGPVEALGQLGKGPIIYIGPIFNRVLTDLAKSICIDLKIPHTIEVCATESSSDLDFVPPLNGGTPVCELSYPGTNYHSFEERVSKRDIERLVKLLYSMCDKVQHIQSYSPSIGGLNEL